MKLLSKNSVLFLILVPLVFIPCFADNPVMNHQGKVHKLSPGIYRVVFDYSLRTNIGVSAGEEGILLMDTGFPETTRDLRRELQKLNKGKIKYIINTHLHGDHIRGNIIKGIDTIVISSKNIPEIHKKGILKQGGGPITAGSEILFETYYTLNFNGEEIRLIPSGGTHSPHDLITWFTGSKVVFMGDLLLSESFPAVSRNIKTYLGILERSLKAFPDDATFVSGHGKDLSKTGFENYLNMLKTTIGLVLKGKDEGKTVAELQQARILKAYESYNTFLDWLNTDYWVKTIYNNYRK